MFEIKKDFTGRRYIESSVNGNKYEIKKECDGFWHIIKVYPYLTTEAWYISDGIMFMCETFESMIRACRWFKLNADNMF